MRCHTAERYINRQLDNELPAKKALRLQKHLSRCSSCRALQKEYQELQHALSSLPQPEYPAFLHHKIMNALPVKSRRYEQSRFRLSLATAALSLLLSIGAGTFVGLKGFDLSEVEDNAIAETEAQLYFGENSLMVVSYDY
ncbi:MAG: zf-HC2 domain-containing protein [Candidatus Cloacimonetes bacterium]|nr:zf-HC2 domain-containing protein [Candidatus Cloacimonadota bacterium]